VCAAGSGCVSGMARREPDYLAPGGVAFWLTLIVSAIGALVLLMYGGN